MLQSRLLNRLIQHCTLSAIDAFDNRHILGGAILLSPFACMTQPYIGSCLLTHCFTPVKHTWTSL